MSLKNLKRRVERLERSLLPKQQCVSAGYAEAISVVIPDVLSRFLAEEDKITKLVDDR